MVAGRIKIELLMSATGRVVAIGAIRAANAVKKERGEMDRGRKRSSSTHPLLFCAAETILSPGLKHKKQSYSINILYYIYTEMYYV